MSMTDEQIRIAIVGACPNWEVHHGGRWCAIRNCQNPTLNGHLFDPLINLNAMHEAEKTLSDEHTKRIYIDHLVCLMKPGEFTVMAPARQRAEAFLKVKGLWRD